MRILILGSGAREHVLAWVLNTGGNELFVAGGNGGTALIASNLDIDPMDVSEVVRVARSLAIDFVVVGPEGPLEKGIVDALRANGISVFGPTRAAAQLETSKSFALQVMDEAFVSHPRSWVFDNPSAVARFVESRGSSMVVKQDGLAGGKGVSICQNAKEAENAARQCWQRDPGRPIIVQEFVQGQEVSVFALTDGWNISELVASCDYKRLKDGDMGPFTGGMGAYAWPFFWTKELENWVRDYVMKPVIRRMWLRKTPYRGILYAGFILPSDNSPPLVLEFNARFGDPEAQVVLPLASDDLLEAMLACAKGRGLSEVPLRWRKDISAVGRVIASEDYPDDPKIGRVIRGIEEAERLGCIVFHAGTKQEGQDIISTGGRVLTVVGIAYTIKEARELSRKGCAWIELQGMQWREDIAI
ncbi:MAG: phosphoribosylamine--glycine ligase [bacterium]